MAACHPIRVVFREAGHRRLTQESGGVAAAYGASSRAGWLGGIPPAPPARKSACLRPRHSCLPGTPRVLPPESAPRARPAVGAPVGRTLAGRYDSDEQRGRDGQGCAREPHNAGPLREAFHKTRHEASGVDARDVRGGKRIRVQGAQAVFRQAILRVKTRRSRARLLAASPVSRRCLALGKSAGCKCGGYRGRKLTAPHAKGCGGKATHRPPDVNLRPRAGTFRRNPSQTERTVTPKSDATRTAHSPSPD